MLSYPALCQPISRRVHPLINVGVRAARAAGRLIMRNFERADLLRTESKGPGDWVSEVDRGAEAEIVRTIRHFYPDHAVLGEEGGASGDSEWCWIIDPLDGTTNFLHRLPHFAVSIAVQHKGRTEHAVVYNPAAEELFVASRGAGAQLDGRRIRVSREHRLGNALIGTGCPIRKPELAARYLPMFEAVVNESAGIRRAGSAALDLAYVACGRLDGFWELNLKPWDIAAGCLLVSEAGGMVSELYGGDVMATGNVLAGNPKIHAALDRLFASLPARQQ